MGSNFISICIPAFKRIEFLERLLDSVSIQEFKDFEVVVTDDSPGDEVRLLCARYQDKFLLHYYKNARTLGTPENWNEAMRQAKGKWIKLMHDDDWFSRKDSLGIFAAMAAKAGDKLIISYYTNVYLEDGREERVKPSLLRVNRLLKNPVAILSQNIIGPPSVIMHRNDKKCFYDHNLKWLVDIDFYIARLKYEKLQYIEQALVHVGLGEEQVTMLCHSRPEIEIPENFYLLQKTGIHHLKNIMVYDAWWRLLRNLKIKDETHLRDYEDGPWPGIILRILRDVRRVPHWMINLGVVSKLAMTISYLKNVRTTR